MHASNKLIGTASVAGPVAAAAVPSAERPDQRGQGVAARGGCVVAGHEVTEDATAHADLAVGVQAMEELASQVYEDGLITQVIRPAAVLQESAARKVLGELLMDDARNGGRWIASPSSWRRYDRPWNGPYGDAGTSRLMGSLQVVYDRPRRYQITVFRVTVTLEGSSAGWTLDSLCDEAFGHAGLTLAGCPRADLAPPPPPFRMR